jgi:hypothetical protein
MRVKAYRLDYETQHELDVDGMLARVLARATAGARRHTARLKAIEPRVVGPLEFEIEVAEDGAYLHHEIYPTEYLKARVSGTCTERGPVAGDVAIFFMYGELWKYAYVIHKYRVAVPV